MALPDNGHTLTESLCWYSLLFSWFYANSVYLMVLEEAWGSYSSLLCMPVSIYVGLE